MAIALFWLFARLPFDVQLATGRKLGSLLYIIIPERRRITATNIGLAFPDKTLAEQRQLAHAVYRHMGMAIAETAYLWFRSTTKLAARFSFDGVEYLQAALADGRGVILLQAHFTTLEVCGGIVGARWPVSAVYDSPKNPLYAAFLLWQRQRHLHGMIDNRDIRSMLRRLKRGEIVWYSPDQTVHKRHGGIATQYFNQPVLTTAGTARMVSMTGATVIPFLPTRIDNGRRYTLKFLPALVFESDDATLATQQINDLFETQIRQQPEQYFWVHKRFRPPGKEFPHPYR